MVSWEPENSKESYHIRTEHSEEDNLKVGPALLSNVTVNANKKISESHRVGLEVKYPKYLE